MIFIMAHRVLLIVILIGALISFVDAEDMVTETSISVFGLRSRLCRILCRQDGPDNGGSYCRCDQASIAQHYYD